MSWFTSFTIFVSWLWVKPKCMICWFPWNQWICNLQVVWSQLRPCDWQFVVDIDSESCAVVSCWQSSSFHVTSSTTVCRHQDGVSACCCCCGHRRCYAYCQLRADVNATRKYKRRWAAATLLAWPYLCVAWWLSGRALDLRFTGRGFNSRPVAFT